MKTLMIALAAMLISASAQATISPLASLVDLDGKPVALESPKDQKLVVFWATWCDECRSKLSKELRTLNQRPDLAVITVNTDRDEARVKEFIEKEKVELPVYRDNSKVLRKELKIFSVPHWALYRRNPATHEFELAASQPAFDYDQIIQTVSGAK